MRSGYKTAPKELLKELGLTKQKFVIVKKSSLIKKEIEKALFSNTYLVFVDGFLDLSLSDISKLKSLKLEEKTKKNDNSTSKEYFISLTQIEKESLQILHVATKKNVFIDIKINLNFKKSSKLDVFSNILNLSNEKFFFNHSLTFILEEKAKASLCLSFFDANCLLNNTFLSLLKKEASLDTLYFMEGSFFEKSNSQIDLEGENSQANLGALFLMNKKRESFFKAQIDHKAPFSSSYCNIKAILNDFAKFSSCATVTIEKNAQKATTKQIFSNYLISETAKAASKPYLNVFADDVKASHGAFFSNLKEEELFYLKARGVDEKTAKGLLIKGICQELINLVKVESLRKILQERPLLVLR